ncbi:MAG: hypothetical protein ACOYL3_29315, partial [Desulfuromonadaceae bacterium]
MMAGEKWLAATALVLEKFEGHILDKYGTALDALAEHVGPEILGGNHFNRPVESEVDRQISLTFLASLILKECENTTVPVATLHVSTIPTSKSRNQLANISRKAAKLLRDFGPHLRPAMNDASKYIRTAPTYFPNLPDELRQTQRDAIQHTRSQHIERDALAKALEAIAETVEKLDGRIGLGHSMSTDTRLGGDIVKWLRVSTGADHHWQQGRSLPHGGRPFYSVA